MAAITTQAIVIKNADYRDNDRMLTLLTPGLGRVDALARGAKKPTSPLLNASELFAFGEYVLYRAKGRASVTSASLSDSFFSLREDYEALRYATYMLQITGAQALPMSGSKNLFTLLLRSLTRICYTSLDKRAVTAAFLLMDAALMGYRPRLEHCVHCGKRLEDARLLDVEEGGLVCATCAAQTRAVMRIAPSQILWMRDVLRVGVEQTALPASDAPLPLLMRYIETRLETRVPAGKGLA